MLMMAELQPKLQGRGSWNAAGMGAKNVLSATQFAELLIAVNKDAGRAFVTVQLYFALMAPLIATVLVALSVAGSTDEFDEKKQLVSAASQGLLMLIPAMKPGEACVPWYAKIWSPPLDKLR